MSAHRVTVTARRFRWFRRPTVTNTFEKDTSCELAEAMGHAARIFGGVVTIEHIGHKPTVPPIDPSSHTA